MSNSSDQFDRGEEDLFKGAEDVVSGENRDTLMSDGGGTGRSDTNDCSDF